MITLVSQRSVIRHNAQTFDEHDNSNPTIFNHGGNWATGKRIYIWPLKYALYYNLLILSWIFEDPKYEAEMENNFNWTPDL